MATLDSTRSGAFHAAARALDAAIDACVEGVERHTSGTTFVPADLARDEHIARYRKAGPVTVVDADGNEVRLARDHWTRDVVLAALIGGLLIWAIKRLPSVPA